MIVNKTLFRYCPEAVIMPGFAINASTLPLCSNVKAGTRFSSRRIREQLLRMSASAPFTALELRRCYRGQIIII